MARFGQKNTLQNVFYSKPTLVVLSILIVFLCISVIERYKIAKEMERRTDAVLEEKSELIERKKALEDKVEYLGAERGLEEEIRTHFDVAKEGEQVIILMGEKKKVSESRTVPPPPKPWYQFW